jgi:hypothetical protein
MLTKIKEFAKKITLIEWIVLGIAVAALVVGLAHNHRSAHKGHQKAPAAVEAPAAE